MSWVEKKIKEYKRGKDATWLEKRLLEPVKPVYRIAYIVITIIIVYGLLLHNIAWIIVGMVVVVVVALIGYLYIRFKK